MLVRLERPELYWPHNILHTCLSVLTRRVLGLVDVFLGGAAAATLHRVYHLCPRPGRAEHACSTRLTTHKCLQCLQCTVDLNCSWLREGEELYVKLVQHSLRVALGSPGDGDWRCQ